MRVLNPRAVFLCDYEMLKVVQELQASHTEQEDAIAAGVAATATTVSSDGVSAEKKAATNVTLSSADLDRMEEQGAKLRPPSNLRQILYGLSVALQKEQVPCSCQSEGNIVNFMNAVQAWERGREIVGMKYRRSMALIEKDRRLTKAERLMLLNHVPIRLVELCNIVEEASERFTAEEMRDLLDVIRHTLPLDASEKRLLTSDELAAAAAEQNKEVGQEQEQQQDVICDEATSEEVYVGHDEGEEGLVDDMDDLQNEPRGETAMDDDPGEED